MGGFNVKVTCPRCEQGMSPANLAKHLPACEELDKHQHLFNTPITIKKFKQFRMRLRNQYGITVQEYEAYLEAQDRTCYICRKLPSGYKTTLCVDHCHKTGIIRGLLCGSCNCLVGLAKDDPGILDRAADYLRREEWHS